MRTLEIFLISVNLLSLVLCLQKQSKKGWFCIAGANLALLFLHGILEGFRYQMVFSYIVVILLVIVAFVKIKQKLETKTAKVLKNIAIGVSFIFLVFTAFLAYAFPVFTLPKPTGSYDVGIQYFHLIDETRADPFLDQTAKKRELMVKIYYPANEDTSKPFSPYFHSSELVRSFAAFYGMPGFMFDHLNLVKTNSKENLQLLDDQANYPVILFSHGAGTTMEAQTSQSEDLASHGYIVVDIDHTYVSAATVFPDHVASHKDATTDFNVAEPAKIITQIMADDASFVINKLEEMQEGKVESIFEGKLDLENIGAMGHSVGGATAYNLAINESRLKAAIDLDGVVFITPGNPKDAMPFLMLANSTYHIQAIQRREPLLKKFEDMDDIDQKITIDIYGSRETYQDAYDTAQQNMVGLTEVLQPSGNLFTIEGSEHMKFTDIGLFIAIPWLREVLGIGGRTAPAKCLEITKAVTLSFFDQHLQREPGTSFEDLMQKYPELKRVGLE